MVLWSILVLSWIITINKGLTEASSYNLVNRTITNSKATIKIETQRYIRYYNTSFNDAKIQWSYLYSALSPVTLPICSNLCMDHDECVSFFYNKNQSVQANCFLNSQALRSDHHRKVTGIDYFELENNCTRNRGICKNYGVCIPDYTTGGSSCECVFNSTDPHCKLKGTIHIVEDPNHTSIYDTVKEECLVAPPNFYLLYKPQENGNNKVYNSWAFKINIPKGAIITKAVFTGTTSMASDLPSYNVVFRYVLPTHTLDFLRTCEYRDKNKLSREYAMLRFDTDHIKINVKFSMDNLIINLIQGFVNDASYTPGTFFQLVALYVSNPQFLQQANFIKCYNFHDDLTKRPTLYIEWS